jgi:hypothetical protein
MILIFNVNNYCKNNYSKDGAVLPAKRYRKMGRCYIFHSFQEIKKPFCNAGKTV